jgi:23S rRNA-/tRNA-specific pseudouridylate synthase
MIPLSADVETVAVLVPGPPPLPEVLYEDDEFLVVDKPPFL